MAAIRVPLHHVCVVVVCALLLVAGVSAEPPADLPDGVRVVLANAKPLELDCATIVRGEDYKAPPNVKGFVEIDGEVEAKALQTQADQVQVEQTQVQESVESDEIKL